MDDWILINIFFMLFNSCLLGLEFQSIQHEFTYIKNSNYFVCRDTGQYCKDFGQSLAMICVLVYS